MEMWYRLLNFGSPIALSAGTDVMNNFYRTMAVGTTRVYVKSDSAAGYRGYLAGLKAGKSFVTNGPLLDFTVDGMGPGGVLPRGGREVAWSLDLHSAVPVDSVQIVVNGVAAVRLDGARAAGSKRYQGKLKVPAGGWIAARALGGPTTSWPAMDSYAFGHTGPVWIGERGSTMPETRKAAAIELRAALQVALGRLRTAYQGTAIPNLEAQFARASARLDSVIGGR
jgi:TolB protein